MRAEVRFSTNALTWVVEGAIRGRPRPLAPDDAARWREWSTTYKALNRERDPAQGLLDLGRRIFMWLDGPDRVVSALLTEAFGTLTLMVQAPRPLADEARDFLHVPWELLADERGFLAGQDRLLFCPVRRLGSAASPPPPPPDSPCLGLAFMAAAPRNVEPVLDYEAEETAILDATETLALDLEVEESGNPERLSERLAEIGPMQAVHLSCHGRAFPRPILALEDDEGNERETGEAELIRLLRPAAPKVVFLSACQSAESDRQADSLAAALVDGGLPAVLGWDASVHDQSAIEFARVFYRQLAARRPLEEACAEARRALFKTLDPPATAASTPCKREGAVVVGANTGADWHMARLWLGPSGGGPLVHGSRRRRLFSADEVYEHFDAGKKTGRIAGRRLFVGRRRDLQRCLALVKSRHKAGVLIHGMGRSGKSSLAARILHRLPALTLVFIEGRFTAATLAAEIADRVPGSRETLRPTDPALLDLAQSEVLLYERLTAVLRTTGTPFALVLDDLEQGLDAPTEAGPWRVSPDIEPALRAVVRAFDRHKAADSILLLTSRHPFTLPDGARDWATCLATLPLPSMDATGLRKLALRRFRFWMDETDQPPDIAAKRWSAFENCAHAARSNPGLADTLLGIATKTPACLAPALEEVERFLSTSAHAPATPALATFFDHLRLSDLLARASEADRALLWAATVFQVPVPPAVIDAATTAYGGSGARLRALGLLETQEDVATPGAPALAVNALIAPRLSPLTPEDATELAKTLVEPLHQAWPSPPEKLPVAAQDELYRLATLADHAPLAPLRVLTAASAMQRLLDEPNAQEAAVFGQKLMAVATAHGVQTPRGVLRRIAQALIVIGDGFTANTLLDKNWTPQGDLDDFDLAIFLLNASNSKTEGFFSDINKNLLQLALSCFKKCNQEDYALKIEIIIQEINEKIYKTTYTLRATPEFKRE
ncbi:CHAT domain-containing protein [Pararhodospirillum oryzae]|uniref:CHAT domain-containing protein n=1 Tax=Pararhodospirillum oryzae TaxID=478448 RepID=A0A512HC51_9PROT|nr:CHAT domain-containing protein [Pararhodospirillum oryzae]GEO83021.1 hypothetical protein ROR02_31520 [Pararhodospirillum oryzae]